MKAIGWLWMAAGCAAMAAAAWGTPLDAASLEREIRGEAYAFGVATGRETAEAGRLAELDTEVLKTLLPLAFAVGAEQGRAVSAELGRRELPPEVRRGLLESMMNLAFEAAEAATESPEVLVELAADEARALWADWEAGAFPEEEWREPADALESFCCLVSVFPNTVPEEELREWEERGKKLAEERLEHRGEGIKAWREEMRAEEEKAAARRARRTAEVERLAAKGEASKRMRRGVELAELGRTRDATAEWKRATEAAESEGDEELAWEARALWLGEGDWSWRAAERRERCEAEIEAGSPWAEYLRGVLLDLAEEEGRWEDAFWMSLEGWLDYGEEVWGIRALEYASRRGGDGLEWWHEVAGVVLEEMPAVEERREEIKRLIELRWVTGLLFPERVGASLESDLGQLRERVEGERELSHKGHKGTQREENEGREDGAGGGMRRPGERWEGAEPSWRTDPAFPEIEREFNELLSAHTGGAALRKAWRSKWSLEERRALRVEGVGAEFVELANKFIMEANLRDDWKALGLQVLEEFKAQEGYNGEALLGVLGTLVERAVATGETDPTELTGWVDWGRRVAAGDAGLENAAALMEVKRAQWLGDEAALRLLADGKQADGLCHAWWERPQPWQILARGRGEREAAAWAIRSVWETPGVPVLVKPLDALAMMDAMTVAELEELRDALRMGVPAQASGWGELAQASGWEELARNVAWLEVGRDWTCVESQLRLARLQERGAECGAEGRALAGSLGEGSARGVAVELKARLAAGDAEDGRWAGWCEGVRRVAAESIDGGCRWVRDRASGCHGRLEPWLECMAQRPLREALSAWGADMTERERLEVAEALEALGENVSEEVLDAWRAAAVEAGEWAVTALERGRAAGEKMRAEMRELEARVKPILDKPMEEWSEEEKAAFRLWMGTDLDGGASSSDE